jgi:hypothetical protein
MARMSLAAGRRLTAPALVVLGALLYACGGEVTEAPDPVPRTNQASAGAAPAAGGTARRDPLAGGSAGRPTMTITVAGGTVRPRYRTSRTVRGGLVEIRLRNTSDVPHKAQLWRITGDHTVKEALRVSHPQPDWLRTAGGVSLTAPRSTSRSLQALPAGRYYVASTLDDPGTVAVFTVTAPDGAPQPPRAPARIEAIDYSFRVSGLRAGRNSVDFDNRGAAPHHAFLAPMRTGATLAEVKRFFNTTSSTGPPPVDAEGTRETVVLEGGERQVTELDLHAGRYALICLVRGREGGPRHIELGMINEVTVR